MHQPVWVSIPSKSQLIATSSCLKAPRVPHRNDLTMSGHLDPRTTRRYDRSRNSLDRHATYALAARLGRGAQEQQ